MTALRNELGQWLVVRLGGGEYALPVEQVGEVLRMVALTPLPAAPRHVAGLVNLRGRGVPVLDLRQRLGLSAAEPGLDAAIVIVEIRGQTLGLIADAAIDVLEFAATDVTPPDPRAGLEAYVRGVARSDSRLILVLDLEQIAVERP
jgi:purine-binding chemotaxis protein CheW